MISFLMIFLITAFCVINNMVSPIDSGIYGIMDKYLISDNLTPFVKIVTQLGDALVIILMTVMGFVLFKDKRIGVSIVINLVTITMLNLILKGIMMRPRPEISQLISVRGYSFPSGHSMVSLAFYGYFIYLAYTYMKNKKGKWAIIMILSAIILLVGLSRIYLGVHFATDVVGGFCFSIFYLFIYIGIVKRIIK